MAVHALDKAVITPMPLSRPVEDLGFSREAFRQILVALDLPEDRPGIIAVTSSIAGEGRTTVALRLADTIASDLDRPVLLAEADLERPSLAKRLRLPASPGLSGVLHGDDDLDYVTLPITDNLFVAPAGEPSADASSLLRRAVMERSFFQGRRDLSAIVLDLPPLLNNSYAALAADMADAVVLVVRAGVTPVDMVRDALARLGGDSQVGVVLNGVPQRRGWRGLFSRR